MTSLVFTLILVVITLAGSLWVMYHMDNNMMPKHRGQPAASERGGTLARPQLSPFQLAVVCDRRAGRASSC